MIFPHKVSIAITRYIEPPPKSPNFLSKPLIYLWAIGLSGKNPAFCLRLLKLRRFDYSLRMSKVYLDYNASAPLNPLVHKTICDLLLRAGNASSVHGFGRTARKDIETSRAQVGKLAGVRAEQVIFNSGATEGNNTILSGYRDKPVLVLSTEHASVHAPAPHATHIPVHRSGLVDLDALKHLLARERPALVALQGVNSETGVIQPVAEAAALVKESGAMLLCDFVQAAGRIPIDFKSLNADYMTLSSHKCGGPQGVGALIFREGLQIPKFMLGGGQEKRQRAGTENVAGIAGFGAAAALADPASFQLKTGSLIARLAQGLRAAANDILIAAEQAPRVSNTLNVILPGVPAETQLMWLDLEQIAVSSGSACSSGTFKPSHVLKAMGYSDEESGCALRFSCGPDTTEAEIDMAIASYARMIPRVRKQAGG